MTTPHDDGQDRGEAYRLRREQLLSQAVAALTEAARQPRPGLTRVENADGQVEWTAGEKDEQSDWAEFVTLALAGATANVGGIETILAGRPGSWEAEGVRQLLHSTLGHEQEDLHEHRTERVVVHVWLDEVMIDLDAWKVYDDAQDELTRRYDALGIPTATYRPGDPDTETPPAPATAEQEQQADALGELEDRLEEQRQRDWADYAQALGATIEAAARRLEGLRVAVVVDLHTDTIRDLAGRIGDQPFDQPAERLLSEAIEATPLPGAGRTPLQRLRDQGHRIPGDV